MNDYAAHKKETENGIEIQTVTEHCDNVSKKAEKYGAPLGLTSLAGLAGLAHDWGKLNVDFNDYITEENELKRGEIDHSFAGAKYLTQMAEATRDKKIIETARLISRTVISHHGLHDWIDEDGKDYFAQRISKDDRYGEITENIKNEISDEKIYDCLKVACAEYGAIRKKIASLCPDKDSVKLAFYFGLLERLVLSILVDADRTDTANFTQGKETECSYDKKLWTEFVDRVEAVSNEYKTKTDRISKLRCDISDRCLAFSDHEVGICKLIVPTGGGKTVSALRFAVHYCKKHGKDRIFYIAPFMSILEQNSKEFKRILGEEYVTEHHSDMVSRIQDKNELQEYELRSDQWDMPIIATTLVQFMNTLFKGRMDSARRMHRLCNAVIIIDEVQSIPAKCVSMFNLAMNFLARIGDASIVLCSATQPTFEKTKYPICFDEKMSMAGDYAGDFDNFRRNCVKSQIKNAGYSYQEAADFCAEKCENEGSVLFITNTKKSASEIYRLLVDGKQTDAVLLHLSTNMCPQHRIDVIQNMRELLKDGRKIICVTTQLIEAGVDVSFPCVIRALAGFDNAAQSAGRCNRNGEIDGCCNVYLLNLAEEHLGNLREIATAQKISWQMLNNEKYSDILSVETMADYFQKYYKERETELDYRVTDLEVEASLIDLLSVNKNRWRLKNNGFSICAQAFKTAGQKFCMIDDNTLTVLVPYDSEAEKLIAKLESSTNDYEIKTILRISQKYTVGLYEQTVKILREQNALYDLPCGVVVLEKGFYNDQLGVVLNGKSMELLMF